MGPVDFFGFGFLGFVFSGFGLCLGLNVSQVFLMFEIGQKRAVDFSGFFCVSLFLFFSELWNIYPSLYILFHPILLYIIFTFILRKKE